MQTSITFPDSADVAESRVATIPEKVDGLRLRLWQKAEWELTPATPAPLKSLNLPYIIELKRSPSLTPFGKRVESRQLRLPE